MKLKALFVACLFVVLSSQAFAHWFPGQAFVSVNPGQVTAQVYNPHYEPIICTGQVFGQTYSGAVFTTYFAEQFMPAGHYRYAFVYTNPYNPFVRGWANINCRFARYW